jgi:nucleoside-diphosphate-sugar epimerase
MSVLITGGAGFIGSVLATRLLDHDYTVNVLDDLLYDNDYVVKHFADHPRFNFIKGDVRDRTQTAKAFGDVERVVHLASIVGAPAGEKNDQLTKTTNYNATQIIADLCQENEIERLVFASTTSVYGFVEDNRVVDESSRMNPMSLYASTKADSEKHLRKVREEWGLPFCILRIATNYGPSIRPRFDLVVNKFVVQALTQKRLTVYGGNQWRPFMHTHDTARALQLALEETSGRVDGETFNAGSNDENYTILEMAKIVSEEMDNQCQVQIMVGEQDNRSYRVDFSKIKEKIGFHLEKNLMMGVKDVRELIENRVNDPFNEKYYNYYLD